jgi:hypothetical protein
MQYTFSQRGSHKICLAIKRHNYPKSILPSKSYWGIPSHYFFIYLFNSCIWGKFSCESQIVNGVNWADTNLCHSKAFFMLCQRLCLHTQLKSRKVKRLTKRWKVYSFFLSSISSEEKLHCVLLSELAIIISSFLFDIESKYFYSSLPYLHCKNICLQWLIRFLQTIVKCKNYYPTYQVRK